MPNELKLEDLADVQESRIIVPIDKQKREKLQKSQPDYDESGIQLISEAAHTGNDILEQLSPSPFCPPQMVQPEECPVYSSGKPSPNHIRAPSEGFSKNSLSPLVYSPSGDQSSHLQNRGSDIEGYGRSDLTPNEISATATVRQ